MRRAREHEQQLLALVARGDHGHTLHHPLEILHRLVPVEHRREFDHHHRRLGEQFVAQGEHVRRAVLDRVGTRAVCIAARGVHIDYAGGRHGAQELHAVGVLHARVAHAECVQVVCGERAQLRLAFHIHRLVEPLRERPEIHAQATRQVHEPRGVRQCGDELTRQPGLGVRGELRRALLHRHMRGVDHTAARRPRGQFGACDAPSGDLVERERQVEPRLAAFGVQGEVARVLAGVRVDERARGLGYVDLRDVARVRRGITGDMVRHSTIVGTSFPASFPDERYAVPSKS